MTVRRTGQLAVREAAAIARRHGHRTVTTTHLLVALLTHDPRRQDLRRRAEALLADQPTGVGPVRMDADLATVLSTSRRTAGPDAENQLLAALGGTPTDAGRLLRAVGIADGDTTSSGLLSTWDVTAADAGTLGARDADIDRLVRGLHRYRRHNPVLVGDRDLDLARIVDGLAIRVATGQVPQRLRAVQLLSVNTDALVLQSTTAGRVERQLERLLDEAAATPVPSILFIDDLDVLLQRGATRAVLSAALARTSIRVVGSAGTWREMGDALDGLMWPLIIDEPSPAATVQILLGQVDRYATHHGVSIERAAVNDAVRLSARYVTDRLLPGKAADVLDEAAAAAAVAGRVVVGQDDVAGIVSDWTRIPVARLLATEAEQLLHLEDRLHERVVGQDAAVAAVAAAVRRARAGVAARDRPLGSFLFLGPTGVGKTELARTLAATIFDEEASLVILDMSEYQEAHAVARLVGAPPGYVGYGEGGQLTERLRRRPYCVVLLDEVEKAHADVFSVLLQLLDEGRLTDGRGRSVDARDAVVIMTSNLGSAYILDPDLDHEELRRRVTAEVHRTFRPEFVNRIDEVVIFRRLEKAELEAIVDIQVGHLRDRLSERGLELSMAPSARSWLAARGYDRAFGARPLRGVLRRAVADPIAVGLLDGTIQEGDCIEVDILPDGGIHIGGSATS